jgi:hypothetical protein
MKKVLRKEAVPQYVVVYLKSAIGFQVSMSLGKSAEEHARRESIFLSYPDIIINDNECIRTAQYVIPRDNIAYIQNIYASEDFVKKDN